MCGHGATAGDLKEDHVFYLRSRGIPEARARGMLIAAFVADAFEDVADEIFRAAWQSGPRAGSTATTRRMAKDRRRPMNQGDSRGFPQYQPGGLWQAADLSRQCRVGSEARQVIDAVAHAYGKEYANVHRGLHHLSNLATADYEKSREAVRKFLNAPSASQIVFTRNATEAINLVAQSFGGLVIEAGDEIVLSILEHHSNIVPWHFHRERHGAVIRWSPVDDEGNFLLDEFEALLGPRTRMVAITHMSNALGTILPIKAMVGLCRDRGIPMLVDGSQAAVHMTVDVQDIDPDFYVFTGHKT